MSSSPAARPRPHDSTVDGIEVVPVNSPADLREFIEFPYRLYRGDPHWVAPLRPDQRHLLDTSRHPFYQHAALQCFLARNSAGICGRIATVIDYYDSGARRENRGAFGFYESIDSHAVAAALFRSARDWLAEKGAAVMRGPLNPSVNYECGLLVDGFDSDPSLMTTYNPSYYARLFESVGLEKARDLYAYRLARDSSSEETIQRLHRAVRIYPVADLRIRPLYPHRFDRDVEAVFHLHDDAWSDNWGSAPMTLDEVRDIARQLKPILIPKLALFAEVGGETAAIGLVVPDANQALKHANGSLFPLGLLKILYYKSRIDRLRVVMFGVAKKHRASGVAAHLYAALIEHALQLGYRQAECSWILEDNRPMNRTLHFLGAEISKTYRIYEAMLSSSSAVAGSTAPTAIV